MVDKTIERRRTGLPVLALTLASAVAGAFMLPVWLAKSSPGSSGALVDNDSRADLPERSASKDRVSWPVPPPTIEGPKATQRVHPPREPTSAPERLPVSERTEALAWLRSLSNSRIEDLTRLRALARQGDELLAQLALNQLVQIPGPSAAAALLDMAKETRDEKRLRAIIAALGSYAARHPEVRDHLLQRSSSDTSWALRAEAARALGTSRAREVAHELVLMLPDEDARVVRRQLYIAIGACGGAEGARYLLEVADLAPVEDHPGILAALSLLDGPEARLLLEDALDSSPRGDIREATAAGLGRIRNQGSTRCLLRALKRTEEWPPVRIAAIMALAAIADPEVLPELETSSKDRNPDVARSAAQAIARIRFLHDEDRFPR